MDGCLSQRLRDVFRSDTERDGNHDATLTVGGAFTNASGAGQMGWAEGSTERTVLHGVVGAGIAALGGGDVVGGALGAAANQLVVQKMADYW
ncbi:hypothetical protein [Dyella sp.]|uniref:hypothetical protein n=1 Tax=Dyella sp. TaxID=1869338 RepID=UPI002FDB92B5